MDKKEIFSMVQKSGKVWLECAQQPHPMRNRNVKEVLI